MSDAMWEDAPEPIYHSCVLGICMLLRAARSVGSTAELDEGDCSMLELLLAWPYAV